MTARLPRLFSCSVAAILTALTAWAPALPADEQLYLSNTSITNAEGEQITELFLVEIDESSASAHLTLLDTFDLEQADAVACSPYDRRCYLIARYDEPRWPNGGLMIAYDTFNGITEEIGNVVDEAGERIPGIVLAGFSPGLGRQLFVGSRTTEELYTVDLTSGVARSLGRVQIEGSPETTLDLGGADLVFDAAGEMFLWTNSAVLPDAPQGFYRVTLPPVGSAEPVSAVYLGTGLDGIDPESNFFTGLAIRANGNGTLVGSNRFDELHEQDLNAEDLAIYAMLRDGEPLGHISGDMHHSFDCSGRIGDRVWHDLDENGLQDVGEPGLEGVILHLFDDLGNRLESRATDATGGYAFDGLCAGAYTVEHDPDSLPEGMIPTLPYAGNDPELDSESTPFTVVLPVSSTIDDSRDLGFVESPDPCESVIGVTAWNDDGDGVRRDGEAALRGLQVRLLDAGGDVLASAVTNKRGRLRFKDLCAGTYQLQYDEGSVPPGLTPTLVDVGDDATDSDPNPNLVVLPDGGSKDLDTAFGFVPAPPSCVARIGARAWHDLDSDGVRDPQEPGISAVEIELRDETGAVLATRTSDSSGRVRFLDLCPGSYSVAYDPSSVTSDLVPTLVDVGNDATDSDPSPHPVVLSDHDSVDVDTGFGFMPRPCDAALTSRVWLDEDQNGGQDGAENGLGGVAVQLADAVGNPLVSGVSTVDEPLRFEGLCAGIYQISYDLLTVPPGLAPTLIDVGNDDLDSDPSPSTVEVGDGDERAVDFGFAWCGECDGKATRLSLRYAGDQDAVVEVHQKDGEVVYAGVVSPAEAFSFEGTDKNGTLGTEISLYVDGELATKIHTSCSVPLAPGMTFGVFEVLSVWSAKNGPVCPLGPCSVRADSGLNFSGQNAEWKLENRGELAATVERITVDWPLERGRLQRIKLGTKEIWSQGATGGTAVIESGWSGSDDDRRLDKGQNEDLVLEFEQDAPRDASAFGIGVDFAEGCAVTFLPGAGGDFSCEGKIVSLSMIWDGDQTIDVLAWKGEPGTDLLADVVGLAPGQSLTVDGYEGAPNSVDWELFDADGFKIGTSRFHLSCSDDEMDGPEDCGSRQGNDKKNLDELVNDWLLAGLTDEQTTLTCTP